MLIDPNAPFFKPLPIRIAVTAAAWLWSIFEMSQGNMLLAILSGGFGAFLLYRLFLSSARRR